MPELPDIELYLSALRPRVVGERLERLRLRSLFLLRSVEVPVDALAGLRVENVSRLGKRLVFAFENDTYAVLHLMIAGRLQWRAPGAGIPAKLGLAAFDFPQGALLLTEAGTKKRASLHLVRGKKSVNAFDGGGLDVLTADLATFTEVLTRNNHTVKRALTDPRLFSGIGNAYSDEILHRAKLSPLKWTSRLSEEEIHRLHAAVGEVLHEWVDRLQRENGDAFPKKVTAFRREMAVHGKYRKPCPVCGAPVQRIVYSENECNYCAGCQTGGKIFADRALSRLLKSDWPRRLEDLEENSGEG